MFTPRPERLPGFTYIGFHRYFLTFCTYDRLSHFTDADAVSLVLSQTQRAAGEQSFAIPAYCFMPDHVHMLVEGLSESSDLNVFIKMAKQYAGYYFSQRFRRRLWQPYVYEHVVRDDEQSETIVEYIVGNPLRAGLVKNPAAYPFVG